MQVEHATSFIISKLEKELPANLSYHNAGHTRSVIDHVTRLALEEGTGSEDFDLLITAAAFHDAGFIDTYEGHEAVSCEMAKRYLPEFDYTESQIARICDLISATRMPQHPTTPLAELLCDSDLYYLGTNDYHAISKRLYPELLERGIIQDEKQWKAKQIRFLQSHRYFTKTAQLQLSVRQAKNLSLLQDDGINVHKSQRHETTAGDMILIFLGVVITSFSLKGFLVPNHFFDGGITGISLLLHEMYHFNLAYVIVLANLPFIIMSVYVINKGFAVKTFFCVLLLGLCLLYPDFPTVTSDKLLVSLFGGFFLGLGIGLTMRAGCAVDGIEVLALYTLRRSSFTISEIILGLNIVIFSLAAIQFGVQTALYSMLTYFAASKTIDYVIEGVEAYTGVTIITGKSEEIKFRLVNELGRGITVYKGERGYLPGNYHVHDECDIVFTIITRLELRKLKNMVNNVDPNAFVFASTIKETSGGVVKKRHVH